MAVEPTIETGYLDALRLTPFEPGMAGRVLSWVRSARDAYWLAPRTRPPLTVQKLLAWGGDGHHCFVLVAPSHAEPLAYGEVNLLNAKRREYWLGHLIVDPQWRRRGLGRRLTELLLRHAFGDLDGKRVSLVVFADNDAAVSCYHAAGMRDDGHETHYFAPYHRRVRLLRMAATADGR
jgi:ribosomal protein S18 acetylase RimI-like enzyme